MYRSLQAKALLTIGRKAIGLLRYKPFCSNEFTF